MSVLIHLFHYYLSFIFVCFQRIQVVFNYSDNNKIKVGNVCLLQSS